MTERVRFTKSANFIYKIANGYVTVYYKLKQHSARHLLQGQLLY